MVALATSNTCNSTDRHGTDSSFVKYSTCHMVCVCVYFMLKVRKSKALTCIESSVSSLSALSLTNGDSLSERSTLQCLWRARLHMRCMTLALLRGSFSSHCSTQCELCTARWLACLSCEVESRCCLAAWSWHSCMCTRCARAWYRFHVVVISTAQVQAMGGAVGGFQYGTFAMSELVVGRICLFGDSCPMQKLIVNSGSDENSAQGSTGSVLAGIPKIVVCLRQLSLIHAIDAIQQLPHNGASETG